MKRFKLKHIRIINTKGSSYELTLIKLGKIAAYYIDSKIDKNTILGISWGNTIFNTDKDMKEKLIQDPYISDTLSLAKRATIILTSVGSIDSTISN